MSTKSVADFFTKVRGNADLTNRVGAITAENKEQWASQIVSIARDEGFLFEASDIEAAVAERKKLAAELGEDELDKVSGGTFSLNYAKIAFEYKPQSSD